MARRRFNKNQPRDKNGRWKSKGFKSAGAYKKARRTRAISATGGALIGAVGVGALNPIAGAVIAGSVAYGIARRTTRPKKR